MDRLTAQEIYRVARQAGFDEDEAVTWTAIALAESSGRPDAHAGSGEDSYGLWQINVASGVRSNRWGDLTDPLTNARAAFELSGGGADMSPWTVTHDSRRGTSTDYRRHREAAEAAAAAGAEGDWNGVGGYGGGRRGGPSPSPPPDLDLDIDAGADVSAPVDSDRDGLTDEFERVAGTRVRRADSDRDGLSDGFEASRSRTDPLSADTDGDDRSDALEWAQGTSAGSLSGVAGVSGSGELRQSVRDGVRDADGDGLSDRFERSIGTRVRRADSDGDGLRDALEHALGTDPLSVDSDRDGLSDGLEHTAGTLAAVPVPVPSAPQEDPLPTGGARVEQFLQAALSQRGDPYVFGAPTARVSDADPDQFDCSELTRWAAGRAGVDLPDGSWLQYLALEQQGAVVPVEEAIRTPGALLFSFSSDPRVGGGRPTQAHVAISLGTGETIEARGRAYGVGQFGAANRFTYAAVIPGLGEAPTASSAGPAPDLDIDAGADVSAPVDSDRDGLTDEFERVAGTRVRRADSDRDGLSDGFEASRSRTDPLSADTDGDDRSDALEWAQGTSAGSLSGVAGVSGSGELRQSVRDGSVMLMGTGCRTGSRGRSGPGCVVRTRTGTGCAMRWSTRWARTRCRWTATGTGSPTASSARQAATL